MAVAVEFLISREVDILFTVGGDGTQRGGSYLNSQFVHVPISVIAQGGKRLDLHGELWRAVLSSTGQPRRFA
jgi:hypothetical protein